MNMVDCVLSGSRRPHIAYIARKFSTRGGAEAMGLMMLDAFRALGTRLTVVARDIRGDPGEFDFVRCDPMHVGRQTRQSRFARRACRIADGLETDLLVTQEHLPCAEVFRADDGVLVEMFGQLARARSRLKRRYDRLIGYQRARLAWERSMYESGQLRAVICISAMVRDDIRRHFSIDPKRLHVIENATDIAHFQRPPEKEYASQLRSRLGIPAEATVLLYVGSGFERKGLATATRAIASAPGDAHLVVVGRDHRARRYTRLARRLGVADRVHFAGMQSDVRPYYWGADALIHPALYEAYGLVVLEAMAAGLPVLTSKTCGAGLSLVRHNENGWLFDAFDMPAWAQAVAKVDRLRTDGGLKSMGDAARDIATRRGGHRRLEREVGDLCRDLLSDL